MNDKKNKTENTRGRGKDVGIKMANSIIEMMHLMYNKNTAMRVLNSLIKKLNQCREEFK